MEKATSSFFRQLPKKMITHRELRECSGQIPLAHLENSARVFGDRDQRLVWRGFAPAASNCFMIDLGTNNFPL